MRFRSLALKLATASTALGIGAIIVITPTDGSSPGIRGRAAVGRPRESSSTPHPFTAIGVPRGTSTATPTPTAPVRPTPIPDEPPPAGVETGGDQPSGPIEVANGNIPENVNASPEFMALRNALEQSIVAYNAQIGGIDVAIAVTDLQTGQTISVGGNVVHRTGCTINMFALFAAVGEFQAGNASPDSVAYSIKKGIGGSYPPEVKNFLETIFGSREAGVESAREQMRSWGMTTSFYDHVPYYGGEFPAPNILTALEANDVFAKLWRGQLFDAEWTAYTIARLRDIAWYVQYILPGRLPSEATVAHKIGYYADDDGWVNNDAGIVSFRGADGREKAYVISYMSQLANTEYIGYSFGAELSRDVWDWFVGKYGLASQATPPPPPPTETPTPSPSATPTSTPTPNPTGSATPTPGPSRTPRR